MSSSTQVQNTRSAPKKSRGHEAWPDTDLPEGGGSRRSPPKPDPVNSDTQRDESAGNRGVLSANATVRYNEGFIAFYGDRCVHLGVGELDDELELVDHAHTIIKCQDAILRCVRVTSQLSKDQLDSHPDEIVKNALVGAELLSSLAHEFLAAADKLRAQQRETIGQQNSEADSE